MSENIPITFKVEPDALFLAMAEENMRLRAEIERLRACVEALEKTLKHAASVSHNGGLVGFSEHDALIAVRKLTLAYWGREHGEAARATLIAALDFAKVEAKP